MWTLKLESGYATTRRKTENWDRFQRQNLFCRVLSKDNLIATYRVKRKMRRSVISLIAINYVVMGVSWNYASNQRLKGGQISKAYCNFGWSVTGMTRNAPWYVFGDWTPLSLYLLPFSVNEYNLIVMADICIRQFRHSFKRVGKRRDRRSQTEKFAVLDES